MSEARETLPTSDDAIHRNIMVHKAAEKKLALAIICINDILKEAQVPAFISWEFTEREEVCETLPEELWLTLQVDLLPIASEVQSA